MSTTLFLTCRMSASVAEALSKRLQADRNCRAWVAACPYNTGPSTHFEALRAKFPDQVFAITTPQTAATILPFVPWLQKQGVKLDFTPDNYRIKCAKGLLEALESDEGKEVDAIKANVIKAHARTSLSLIEAKEARDDFYLNLTTALGWQMNEVNDRLNFHHPKCVCHELPHITYKGEDYDIGRAYGKALTLAGPNGALLDIFSAIVFLGQLPLPTKDVKMTMEEVEAAVKAFIIKAEGGWEWDNGHTELWMDGESDDWAAMKLCNKFIPNNFKVIYHAATTPDYSLHDLATQNAGRLGLAEVHPDPEATNFHKAIAATREQLR